MVMNIRVLTPDRIICSTTANEVVLPGVTGQIGVLEGHASLITALDTGLLRIKLDQKWTPIILWRFSGNRPKSSYCIGERCRRNCFIRS